MGDILKTLARAGLQYLAAFLVVRGFTNEGLSNEIIGIGMAIVTATVGCFDVSNENSGVTPLFGLDDQTMENLFRQAVHFGAGFLAFKGIIPGEYVSQSVAFAATALTFWRSMRVKGVI